MFKGNKIPSFPLGSQGKKTPAKHFLSSETDFQVKRARESSALSESSIRD